MKTKQAKLKNQKGSSFVEYALAAALLVGIFIVAGKSLIRSSDERFDNSVKILNGMAPCGASGGSLDASRGECL